MKEKIGKLMILIFAMLLCIMSVYAGGTKESAPGVAQYHEISFGGSSPGGVFFYMVGVMAPLVSDQIPNVNMTNVATGASVDNVIKIMLGELDFGLAHGSHTFMGANSQWRFADVTGSENIRGIAYAYESPHYFVALKRSGITSMADLAGKRVAMGQPGSGAQFNSDLIIDVLGIDVQREYLQFADAGRGLKEGRISALGQSGAPSGAVAELAETDEIVIIPFSQAEMDKLMGEVSFYHSNRLSKDTYRGMTEDVLMPHFPIFWLGHKDLSDDVVYNILDVVFKPENFRRLGEDHVMWRQLKPGIQEYENLKGPAMHPGAVKFYQDKNLR